MKKILIVSLCLMILTGCSTKSIETTNTDKIKVVSTIFPGYDFTKSIGDDLVDVSILMPLGAESHSYEPSPQDIIKIENADLFIYTGGDSDKWIEKILNSSNKKIKTLKLMDAVSELEEMDEHEDEHEEQHEVEYDEHVWTSPKNAIKITQKIADSLINIDNSNEAIYKENCDKYTNKLQNLDNEFAEFLGNVKNRTLIFGDRFPFKYLAKEYNIMYHAAYEGCSTDVEPSVSTIASIIDTAKHENIKTVFYIELSSQKVATSIAESIKGKTALLHSCHNVSKDEFNNKETYISLMEKNLKTLKEVLE